MAGLAPGLAALLPDAQAAEVAGALQAVVLADGDPPAYAGWAQLLTDNGVDSGVELWDYTLPQDVDLNFISSCSEAVFR